MVASLAALGLFLQRASLAEDPPPTEQPARVTQVWPPHAEGASQPNTNAPSGDPQNTPQGGQLWKWTITPPYLKAADGSVVPYTGAAILKKRVCDVHVIPQKLVNGAWVDDPHAKIAGKLTLATKSIGGGEFWEGNEGENTWYSRKCKRPMPVGGFTFQASLTADEAAKSQPRKIRFRLTNSGLREPTDPPPPPGSGDTVTTTDTWTDPAGDDRDEPLTGPVTTVALWQEPPAGAIAFEEEGMGGVLAVVGTTVSLNIEDSTAANEPFTFYKSLNRDWSNVDPSPSGLSTVDAPVPAAWGVSLVPSGPTLSSTGTASATLVIPNNPSLVGRAFWIQVGVGADAAHGLSPATTVALVHSLADYDGDGLLNDDDPLPFDAN